MMVLRRCPPTRDVSLHLMTHMYLFKEKSKICKCGNLLLSTGIYILEDIWEIWKFNNGTRWKRPLLHPCAQSRPQYSNFKTELMDPELIRSTNEVIKKNRVCMQIAQSRQKSYADVRQKDLEFEVGDKVFLKVAPMKGVLRFEKKGKLSPRFVGSFEI